MSHLPGVTVELCEDRFEQDWPALWLQTGADGSGGLWKHRALWRLYVAVICAWGVREFREHAVFASQREVAVSCLLRDLGREEDWWQIRLVKIYRVVPPPTKEQVLRIEAANGRLARERAARGGDAVDAMDRRSMGVLA